MPQITVTGLPYYLGPGAHWQQVESAAPLNTSAKPACGGSWTAQYC